MDENPNSGRVHLHSTTSLRDTGSGKEPARLYLLGRRVTVVPRQVSPPQELGLIHKRERAILWNSQKATVGRLRHVLLLASHCSTVVSFVVRSRFGIQGQGRPHIVWTSTNLRHLSDTKASLQSSDPCTCVELIAARSRVDLLSKAHVKNPHNNFRGDKQTF